MDRRQWSVMLVTGYPQHHGAASSCCSGGTVFSLTMGCEELQTPHVLLAQFVAVELYPTYVGRVVSRPLFTRMLSIRRRRLYMRRFVFSLRHARSVRSVLLIGIGVLAISLASVRADSPKASTNVVRVVYFVPTDRTVREDYVDRLQAAVEHLQIWYRNEMGNGTTFSVKKRVVEVVQASHASSWYSTNPAGDYPLWFWNNVLADAFALTGGMFFDPNNVWAIYIDSDPACGQAIGATAGVSLLPANDLRGLAGEANVPPCAGDQPDTAGVCRWVGGLGHELGHAFGLPHPAGCEGADANTVCPSDTLMWLGYITYPQTFLLESDKATLAQSLFFSAIRVRRSLPECSGGKQ